jgi:hypothetical protein
VLLIVGSMPAVLCFDLIPLLDELRSVEPELMLCQFYDFRFRVDAAASSISPSLSKCCARLRDPGLSSRNLLFPLSVRFPAVRSVGWSRFNGLQLRPL